MSVNGRDLGAADDDRRRSASPSRSSGTASIVRKPQLPRQLRPCAILGVRLDIGDVHRLPLEHARAATSSRADGMRRSALGKRRSSGVMPCARPTSAARRRRSKIDAASSASHSRAALSTIASSTGCRSNGERLMTLSTSAVAVCCSQRLGQLARARLHLLEQPHVLDGDDRLVGEGLEQLDLLVAERATSVRRMHQRADRVALAQQRHGEHRPDAEPTRQHLTVRKLVSAVGSTSWTWIGARPALRGP